MTAVASRSPPACAPAAPPCPQAQRLANLELLTQLSAAHGRCLGSASLESIGIATK
jgi:hypothetical protein